MTKNPREKKSVKKAVNAAPSEGGSVQELALPDPDFNRLIFFRLNCRRILSLILVPADIHIDLPFI